MNRSRSREGLCLAIGILWIVGCERPGERLGAERISGDTSPIQTAEQPVRQETEPASNLPPDSTAILDALRSLGIGERNLQLNWFTLGDVVVEMGGTSFQRQDPDLSYWRCFDLGNGIRVLLGAPDIPGEPQDLEMFAAGPRSWVGGPEECEDYSADASAIRLANGLAIGAGIDRMLEMLSEPQARQGPVYHYRAWKKQPDGLPILGELEVLVEDGAVVGMRGLRCYCRDPSGSDAG